VIALDTNILLYAHRADSEHHQAALACVTAAAEGPSRWAIPWPCVHEFVAIATHPRIWDPPSSLDETIDQIEAWMESPTLVLLGEVDGYWPVLRSLLGKGKVAGPKIHDARIAAICVQHGVTELLSADRDFSRFPTLSTRNPLV
jgi:toxin-antitoxin system PIN domain toxin